jgi:hypothetical protein
MSTTETADGTRPVTRRFLWGNSLIRAEDELRANEVKLNEANLTHGSTPQEYRAFTVPIQTANGALRERIAHLRSLLAQESK